MSKAEQDSAINQPLKPLSYFGFTIQPSEYLVYSDVTGKRLWWEVVTPHHGSLGFCSTLAEAMSAVEFFFLLEAEHEALDE